jgi:hypothetical protein
MRNALEFDGVNDGGDDIGGEIEEEGGIMVHPLVSRFALAFG